MSEEEKKGGADAGADADHALLEDESPALRALLKRSLAGPEPAPGGPTPDEGEEARLLLSSVQRKLRQRSKGKFYADGWSTSPSRVNYGVVAAVMLVVIVAVYLSLGPMGISLN